MQRAGSEQGCIADLALKSYVLLMSLCTGFQEANTSHPANIAIAAERSFA